VTRTRSLQVALLAAVCLLLIAPAATGGPSPVTDTFPNGLPPGAVAVDEDTVAFDGGAVLLELGPTSFASCPSGWLCLFQHANWNGRMLQFRDTGFWQNLTNYGFNDQMSSWRNRRGFDARWAEHVGGNGFRRCMATGAAAAYVGDSDNDEASSIKIFTSNIC
jgi:Peptidase inhibitor family I36